MVKAEIVDQTKLRALEGSLERVFQDGCQLCR